MFFKILAHDCSVMNHILSSQFRPGKYLFRAVFKTLLKAINYFRKKASSQMFDWVLSTPCCSESTIKTLEQRPWKSWIRGTGKMSDFQEYPENRRIRERNQAKMERTKNFDICFSVMFSCYEQSLISVQETGHQAFPPTGFQISLIFPSFLRF